MRGHGIIVNASSWASFIFEYNPEKIETTKKINYVTTPNIGGAYQQKYFSGFETKEVSFKLVCVDMESPTGVSDEIAFFESLREPDPGLLGGFGLSYGNENYPPPQVLFQFGTAFVPLVWDVLDIKIEATHFHSGIVTGVIGIPKKCEIQITLSLDEGHILNKANQIAKRVQMYAAMAKSVVREVSTKKGEKRRERFW